MDPDSPTHLFTLHDDGRTLAIGGYQQLPPRFAKVAQVGSAVAHDGGTRRLTQETHAIPEGLHLVQSCSFARAEFVLRRTHADVP